MIKGRRWSSEAAASISVLSLPDNHTVPKGWTAGRQRMHRERTEDAHRFTAAAGHLVQGRQRTYTGLSPAGGFTAAARHTVQRDGRQAGREHTQIQAEGFTAAAARHTGEGQRENAHRYVEGRRLHRRQAENAHRCVAVRKT